MVRRPAIYLFVSGGAIFSQACYAAENEVLMMRPRDWFRLAVRIIGFWFLASAAAPALWAVWKYLGGAGNPAITPGAEVASALIDLIRGLAVLLLVEPIVWLFCGMPAKRVAPDSDGQVPPAANG
jgi:hypothetical protein